MEHETEQEQEQEIEVGFDHEADSLEELFLSEEDEGELAGLLRAMAPAPLRTIPSEEEENETATSTSLIMDFADLDSLLAESITTSTKKAEVIRARKALQRGNVIGAERAKLQAIVAKWELEREWNVVGQDALFETQQCKCGNVQYHFLGFFQKQQHRTSAITPWLTVDEGTRTLEELPRGIKEELFQVPICIKCAVRSGWGVPV